MNLAGFSKRRRLFVLLSLCSALVLAVIAPAFAQAATYPNSMAAMGDSITRAFNTGSLAFTDAPANSWSTGTNSTVKSQYSRILAANPAISGKNYNDAKTGAKIADLPGQANTVVSQNAEYVTILIGANDVCTSSESTMTPVDTFQANFTTAMNTLTSGLPNARIFVSSIPNIYNLWSVLHTNGTARFVWALYGICQSMLANSNSTAQADVDRRARVLQREVAFNNVLASVCASYGSRCQFDNNAIFNTAFLASDVSTRDYFHPSIAGQAKLANVTWGATFNFAA